MSDNLQASLGSRHMQKGKSGRQVLICLATLVFRRTFATHVFNLNYWAKRHGLTCLSC